MASLFRVRVESDTDNDAVLLVAHDDAAQARACAAAEANRYAQNWASPWEGRWRATSATKIAARTAQPAGTVVEVTPGWS